MASNKGGGGVAVAAVIDWEFAGIADPRLDVARFARLERWDGDVEVVALGNIG